MTSRSSGSEALPAREAALRLVAKRMLSEAELRQRLAVKGYDEKEIDDATDLLCSYGYVNDGQLATAVTREAERTCRGPRWVHSTLLRRGVDEAAAQSAAERSSDTALERARQLVARRFPTPLDDRQRRKAHRYLVGRGFAPELVSELLGEATQAVKP